MELIQETANACAHALECGGKLIFFSNGGSAADAQHLAVELTGRYLRERRALPKTYTARWRSRAEATAVRPLIRKLVKPIKVARSCLAHQIRVD